MKKTLILFFILFSTLQQLLFAQVTSDKEQYRRSSLTLILLTHSDKHYATEMERVFKNFPLPARYNEHNISDIRVISVKGKQSKVKIDKLISENNVAQKVVARWFNRDPYSGFMNMDLIHDRGGYGAFYEDYQRSQNNIRGVSMLRDEGIELLQNSFVLVCDMDYIDKKKGAKWGALGLALAGAVMQGVAIAQNVEAQRAYNSGNYREARKKSNQAQAWSAGGNLSMVGAAVVSDIGGFSVKMNAYLYRLKWDDRMTNTIFGDYWLDSETPSNESVLIKNKFDNAKKTFSLEFVGQYNTKSSKTILRSWSNEDEVILDVCERCVNKGMTQLAKRFPIFRPRSPFYFDGNAVYSHIGTKEEVSTGKRYEIVQPYKDKKGQVKYKRVGMAQAGRPWQNTDIRFDQYFDSEHKGTPFKIKRTSFDMHTPGLQLREI